MATYVTLTPTEEGKQYVRHLMLQKAFDGDDFPYENDYSIYSVDSVEQWIEQFRGLYIAPDPDQKISEYGKGTVFGTKLETSGLAIYGRTRVKEDPSLIQDTVGMVYYFYETTKTTSAATYRSIRSRTTTRRRRRPRRSTSTMPARRTRTVRSTRGSMSRAWAVSSAR